MHVQVLIQPVLQGGCRQCKLGLFNSPVFRVISSSYSPLKILAAPLSTSTSVWPGVALPSCRNAKSKHKSLLSSDRPDSASLSATANVHFEAHAFSDQTMKVGLRSEWHDCLSRGSTGRIKTDEELSVWHSKHSRTKGLNFQHV